jgi:hypothetical protein
MPLSTIPKVIYICDKTIDQIAIYSKNWKMLNPNYRIILFDDEKCRTFIHNNFKPIVLEIYDYIPSGPIKADLWRICILLKYGGIYVDADVEPILPLHKFLIPNADFITCKSYLPTGVRKFNPNFIVSNKNNPILHNALLWYVNKYNKVKKNNKEFSYWNWSIMTCFTYVLPRPIRQINGNKLDNLIKLQKFNLNLQLITETKGDDHYDDHNIFRGQRVFNNRYPTWDYISHSFATDEEDTTEKEESKGETSSLI